MRTLFHTNKIDVLGILESKLDDKSLSYMMRIHFSDMSFSHNFFLSDKGRILVLWNPSSVSLNVVDLTDQFMHVSISCLVTKKVFMATFVYGYNKIFQRIPL